jgi:hypothetical protein
MPAAIDWIFGHIGLMFFLLVVSALLRIVWGVLVTGKKRLRRLNDYVQARGYHFINAQLPQALEMPIGQLMKMMNLKTMKRGTDGITDIREFGAASGVEAFDMSLQGRQLTVFKNAYSTGSGEDSSTITMRTAKLDADGLPAFRLEKRGVVTKVETFVNKMLEAHGVHVALRPVDLPDRPAFSRLYLLTAVDEAATRSFFTEPKLAAFEYEPLQGEVAANVGHLVYFETGKFTDDRSYDDFIARAKAVFEILIA